MAKKRAQDLATLRRSAASGDPVAQYQLAGTLAGRNTESDLQEAAEWYARAAHQGVADAQYMLAMCYSHGMGVSPDERQAAVWFEAAARLGHAPAQYNLGIVYLHGIGYPPDTGLALEWLDKSAAQGYAESEHALGILYANGDGVTRDESRATEWLFRAAKQGFAASQYSLGIMYADGEGLPQDYSKAAEWIMKAADQGFARAELQLGIMFATGQGVERNDAKSLLWTRRAAEQGLADAQYFLGLSYASGQSAPRDVDEARHWLRAAAEQGHPDALGQLDNVPAPSDGDEDAGYFCARGISAWDDGDYSRAVRYYERALAIDPIPTIYLNLAVCLDDMGARARAVDALAEFYAAAALHDVREVEPLLRQQRKAGLINAARAAAKKRTATTLGSRVASWSTSYVGKRVDIRRMEAWRENDLQQLYRHESNVYVWRCRRSAGERSRFAFLFIRTQDNATISEVSYSLMHFGASGEFYEVNDGILPQEKEQLVSVLDAIVEQ